MYNYAYDVPVEEFFSQEHGLLDSHWSEIASNKEAVKLSPNKAAYADLQAKGVLRNICAYSNGVLVGYVVTFITPHLHYMEDKFAAVDVIYVSPDSRASRVGLALIDKNEALCKADGASVITYHCKVEHPALVRILERKGYACKEVIMVKCIKGEE